MKGERRLKVGEKSIKLCFDWGAVEDFCEAEGLGFADFDKAMQSPKKLRSLIYHMALSAGEQIEADELRKMAFSQMTVVSQLIEEAMGEGKGKAGK